MSNEQTLAGDGKESEQMRGSCFWTLTCGVSGDGESSGVSKWQLILSIEALESRDWQERVEGDELREPGVSALVGLMREDEFSIVGDSERHPRPEEISLLMGAAGKGKSNVVACCVSRIVGVSEDSEVDETPSVLKIAGRDTYRIISWSESIIDDSERCLEADKVCALLEIAAGDVFVIIA